MNEAWQSIAYLFASIILLVVIYALGRMIVRDGVRDAMKETKRRSVTPTDFNIRD